VHEKWNKIKFFIIFRWEGVGWEGGDEWVRAQFRFYLAGLLRTSLEGRGRPEMHLYNSHYMAALDAARWYQAWARAPPPPAIAQLPPGARLFLPSYRT
jgi:hypothetical protein